MSLNIYENIVFYVNQKEYKIQLCFGDITKLPLQEKVDLVMVSAFPNDYSALSGTLIGALYKELDINVFNLSMNKREDLRAHFHCWISQDLPESVPYRRLLCFEQTRQNFQHDKHNLVGKVFRALCSTFSEEDNSVITPLLATGNQGCDKSSMLRAMVSSAINWMKAGMPINKLMLVIYTHLSKSTPQLSKADMDAVTSFQDIKKQMDAKHNKSVLVKTPSIQYDFFLVNMDEDQNLLEKFNSVWRQQFGTSKTLHMRLRSNAELADSIVSYNNSSSVKTDDNDNAASPQQQQREQHEDMRRLTSSILNLQATFMSCFKIVIFLSPRFMISGSAIEVYNLTLCLSRQLKRNLLVPVYIEEVKNLPIYMTLRQWIDCRIKDRSDHEHSQQITNCVHCICKLLDEQKNQIEAETNQNVAADDKFDGVQVINQSQITEKNAANEAENNDYYDVFISYSHKDSKYAQRFLNVLHELSPEARIFFDINQLKAGYAWQSELYTSLSKSKVILAFISANYCTSPVCREEFSIALNRHCSKQAESVLVPILVTEAMASEDACLYDCMKQQHTAVSMPLFITDVIPTRFVVDANAIRELCIDLLKPYKQLLSLEFAQANLKESLFNKNTIAFMYEQARRKYFESHFKIKPGKRDYRKITFQEDSTDAQRTGNRVKEANGLRNVAFNSKPFKEELPIMSEEEYEKVNPEIDASGRPIVDIVIAFHNYDILLANRLLTLIKEYFGNELSVKMAGIQVDDTSGTVSIELLEQSRMNIVLINCTYLLHENCLHQLHVAINLHRKSLNNINSPQFFPIIIDHFPSNTNYFQMLPALFCSSDEHIKNTADQLFEKHTEKSDLSGAYELVLRLAVIWLKKVAYRKVRVKYSLLDDSASSSAVQRKLIFTPQNYPPILSAYDAFQYGFGKIQSTDQLKDIHAKEFICEEKTLLQSQKVESKRTTKFQSRSCLIC